VNFSSVPWRSGPLDPKIKEFVYIAVDAAATHLYVPGIRQHIKLALSHGATAEEIMEVLELTATLGIHACNIGVPILLEELEAAGQPIAREYSERQLELKKDFEAKRGYWNDFWNEMLLLDADLFAAYTDFSSVPYCYVYESFTGADGDGRFIPIGLAFSSMERCMLTMEEMWRYVEGEVTRIVPFHEQNLWNTFPTRLFDDTLHVAELSLAPGEPSRIETAPAAG
jgi:hypothetical protein